MRTASEIDVSVAGIADAEGVPIGAGTTLAAVWIKENCMHWISVGDSKIYLVRGHQTRCLTTPHNYKMLLDKRKQAGTITSEQYEAELSRGEALVSYIGMNGLKYMDVSMEGLELEAEDQIVLCSDGFTGSARRRIWHNVWKIFQGIMKPMLPSWRRQLFGISPVGWIIQH